LIELCKDDVTRVLCVAPPQSKSAQAPKEKDAKNRSRPALERACRAIDALYPNGVPDQAAEPNAKLCRRVGDKLKSEGLPNVSDDTMLRAAGRRK
jgi:hypothetical protein